MKVTLTNKKYKMTDFVRISFLVCPFYTTAKIIIRIITALIPSMQVLVTARFIDTALAIFNGEKGRSSIYLPLILLMLILTYTYLSWHLMAHMNLKYDMRMASVFGEAVLQKRGKLEYRHIENNDTWDLIFRTSGVAVGAMSMGFQNIMDIGYNIIRVVSLLVILMSSVWWTGLVIVAITIPLFALSIKAGKESYKANIEAEKHSRRAGYLQSVLLGRENVDERELFGYSDGVNKQWHDKYETARKIRLKVDLKYYIRMKGSSIITVFISLLIIGVLLFPLSVEKITIGMFIGLVGATLELIQLMSWQLSDIMSSLARNKGYLKDFTAFCALSETNGALDLPRDANELKFESIEFKNVSFKYPDTEKYILRNFSLKLEKNAHYAFVGINGAGKTTFTKLLTGMYDDFDGEILINQKSIHEYSQADLKGFFAVVYQDFAKYYISMKDNIALGNILKSDEEEINESASVIGLDNAISNLPYGLDTWLGKIKEGGVDLSGGEWQRVAIARALYNPAQVRILDEPTAALDPVAESKIYELFGRISMGKSTIFITHRLGAAKLADEIIVIDEGMVKEKGSHDDLMKEKGIYTEMFEAQRSWYQ